MPSIRAMCLTLTPSLPYVTDKGVDGLLKRLRPTHPHLVKFLHYPLPVKCSVRPDKGHLTFETQDGKVTTDVRYDRPTLADERLRGVLGEWLWDLCKEQAEEELEKDLRQNASAMASARARKAVEKHEAKKPSPAPTSPPAPASPTFRNLYGGAGGVFYDAKIFMDAVRGALPKKTAQQNDEDTIATMSRQVDGLVDFLKDAAKAGNPELATEFFYRVVAVSIAIKAHNKPVTK